MPFVATWMGLEVSQKEKDKYHMIPLKCGIYNMTQMNLQKDTDSQRSDLWLLRQREEGRDELGAWD